MGSKTECVGTPEIDPVGFTLDHGHCLTRRAPSRRTCHVDGCVWTLVWRRLGALGHAAQERIALVLTQIDVIGRSSGMTSDVTPCSEPAFLPTDKDVTS